jgi:organic radical activating enzyme
MEQIKVSELFYSIQGEGRYMGVPSVFLRTFGCNFKCAGFGMPQGELSEERFKIDANIYRNYDDLPLVSTGCDSYASWDPRFKHLSPFKNIPDLALEITNLLPNKRWQDEHLVITGGEPLLGWQRAFPVLLEQENMRGLRELTFETNGTQPLSPALREYLYHWGIEQRGYPALTFSVSPKLSCSGELAAEAIQPEVVAEYEKIGYTYLKFVVANEEDVTEALQTIQRYRDCNFRGPVYLMPVGGVESVYNLNKRQVAELAMQHGLRFSDRLHVSLWKNAWGT